MARSSPSPDWNFASEEFLDPSASKDLQPAFFFGKPSNGKSYSPEPVADKALAFVPSSAGRSIANTLHRFEENQLNPVEGALRPLAYVMSYR